MKKLTIISIAFCVFLFQANAQSPKQENTPGEQSIVKKEFDENGNLMTYDSTYIQQWSSDSTFNFNEGYFTHGFPDLNKLMDDLLNDSSRHSFTFPEQFFSFNDDDFFNHFNFAFPDSEAVKKFPFHADSIYHSMFPALQELEKQLNYKQHDFDFQKNTTPNHLSKTQKEELKELQKKHFKELEELKKKWKKEEESR